MDEWASTRTAIKRRFLVSMQAGLRIALHNCVSDVALRSQLVKLSQTVEESAANDSPKLEATIEAFASGPLPSESAPANEHLDQFFRGQSHGPHDFALFAGTNPWTIDMVFGKEQGPWPKPELLLDQITRSFIFVASLRRRAEAELKGLERTIRVELAVALREALSDIEADLAGYFIFRDILSEIGLRPVLPTLGERVEQKELSSQKHKLIRDPNRQGLLRVFGLGIRVENTIVGSATVMKSGDEDDRD